MTSRIENSNGKSNEIQTTGWSYKMINKTYKFFAKFIRGKRRVKLLESGGYGGTELSSQLWGRQR
jgi:hypothetical protein